MAFDFNQVEEIFKRIDSAGGMTDAMKEDISSLRNATYELDKERNENSEYRGKYESTLSDLNKERDNSMHWSEKYNDLAKKYKEVYGSHEQVVNTPESNEPTDEYALGGKLNPTSYSDFLSINNNT